MSEMCEAIVDSRVNSTWAETKGEWENGPPKFEVGDGPRLYSSNISRKYFIGLLQEMSTFYLLLRGHPSMFNRSMKRYWLEI